MKKAVEVRLRQDNGYLPPSEPNEGRGIYFESKGIPALLSISD